MADPDARPFSENLDRHCFCTHNHVRGNRIRPRERQGNVRRHGLSLSLAESLDWDNAVAWPDIRFDYGETRMNAIVPGGNRLYFVTFTERGEGLRPISLRPAENLEKKRYVEEFR
ncbi:MAG: BrnT family toxin [Candidatus Accumulibacter sp.]|jgi:uncharacterized DUF497 family protein|nr:BrnT family toxin [Accumulibacter sp.]